MWSAGMWAYVLCVFALDFDAWNFVGVLFGCLFAKVVSWILWSIFLLGPLVEA